MSTPLITFMVVQCTACVAGCHGSSLRSTLSVVVIALFTLVPVTSAAAVASSLTPDYTPIGTIVPFTNTTNLPPGYLPCDGHEYFISSYPALFAVIGTTFVSPANSVAYAGYKFNVPDLRGVFPVGVGSNSVIATTSRVLGALDGSENTTLSTTNLPSHTHDGDTGSGLSNVDGFNNNEFVLSRSGWVQGPFLDLLLELGMEMSRIITTISPPTHQAAAPPSGRRPPRWASTSSSRPVPPRHPRQLPRVPCVPWLIVTSTVPRFLPPPPASQPPTIPS